MDNRAHDFGRDGNRMNSHIVSSRWCSVTCLSAVFALGGVFSPSLAFSAGEQDAGVAYLMPGHGKVAVLRGGSTSDVTSTCMAVQEADSIDLGTDSTATVVFPDGVYSLNTAGIYKIRDIAVTKVVADKEEEIQPVLGVRGRGNSLMDSGSAKLVMPPARLFDGVKPPVMRDPTTDTGLTVLSPRGNTFSAEPELVWTGDKKRTYSVSIVPLDQTETESQSFVLTNVVGCEMTWPHAVWSELKRGQSYRVVVISGEFSTDENQTFSIVTADKAGELTASLDKVGAVLPEGPAILFVRGNLLASDRWGCYAEARLLAFQLHQSDPSNDVYLKLMQRCYAGLGIADGYWATQRKIDSLQSGK